jgi:polyhydroxyalkanoate synthesis regulator phasin
MTPGPDDFLRDAVILTRERLQDALDDAVRRGRMTRDDAAELFAELVRRGRDGVDSARRATGLSAALPIADYDDLTAVEVTERLAGLAAPELRRVRDHERRHGNRKSVLAAIERRLA